MKQFKMPENKDNRIFPDQYKKDAIIAFEIDGNIYIINEIYPKKATAHSLHSSSFWKDRENVPELIKNLLRDGIDVYQFETQKEFIEWISGTDYFKRV